MKIFKIIFTLCMLLVLGLVISLIILINSFNINAHKESIELLVSEVLGREFKINQDINLAIRLSPTVVIKEASLANPSWAKPQNMISIQEVSVRVSLLSILEGTIKIDDITVTGLSLYLEQNDEGRNNWTFTNDEEFSNKNTPNIEIADNEAEASLTTAPLKDELEKEGFSLSYDIGTLHINDSQVVYSQKGKEKNQTYTLLLNKVFLNGDGDIKINAAFNGQEVAVNGSFANLQEALNDNENLGVDLLLQSKPYTLALKGEIEQMLKLAGININIEAAGANVPYVDTFSFKALVKGNLEKLAIQDINLTAGNEDNDIDLKLMGSVANVLKLTDFNLNLNANIAKVPNVDYIKPLVLQATIGDGETPLHLNTKMTIRDIDGKAVINAEGLLDFSKDKPSIIANIVSETLDIASVIDFDKLKEKSNSVLEQGGTEQSETDEGELFFLAPDKLPFEALNAVNAELNTQFAAIIIPYINAPVKADMNLLLKDAKLSLNTNATNEQDNGKLDLDLELDASIPAQTTLALKGSGNNIHIGNLLANVLGKNVEGGTLSFKVNEQTTGDSAHLLAANLTGDIELLIENTKIIDTAIIAFGSESLKQITKAIKSNFTKIEDSELLDIQCMAANLKFKDGKASFKNKIGIETSEILASLSGDLNLETERMDLTLNLMTRSILSTGLTDMLAGLISVKGSFLEPSIGVSSMGALKAGATIGSALFTGGLSLLGQKIFDTVVEDESPCSIALGRPVTSSTIIQKQQSKNTNQTITNKPVAQQAEQNGTQPQVQAEKQTNDKTIQNKLAKPISAVKDMIGKLTGHKEPDETAHPIQTTASAAPVPVSVSEP